MNGKEREYHENSIQEAIDEDDGEAEFEARAEYANARAWERYEEEGRWVG